MLYDSVVVDGPSGPRGLIGTEWRRISDRSGATFKNSLLVRSKLRAWDVRTDWITMAFEVNPVSNWCRVLDPLDF